MINAADPQTLTVEKVSEGSTSNVDASTVPLLFGAEDSVKCCFPSCLNWPLGLIILLAGFRCHTVWEVWEGLKGHGARAKAGGREAEEAFSPRCAVSMLVLLWPQGQSCCGAETSPHLDLPSFCFLFVSSVAWVLSPGPSRLGDTHCNHRCPLVASK